MSDASGWQGAGAYRTAGRPGGFLLPVVLGTLAIALLIGGTLGFMTMVGGAGGDDAAILPDGLTPAGATGSDERVVLTVTFKGDGGGSIRVTPGGITCSDSCELRFPAGTQLAITADPGKRSRFGGWGEACENDGDCALTLGRDRALTVSFQRSNVPLRSAPSDTDDDEPRVRGNCNDGIDNDGDGLTDGAQDPNCLDGDTETATRPRRSPAADDLPTADDCTDGKDNDGDGFTDVSEDPDCLVGSAEQGTGADSGDDTGGTPAGGAAGRSDCQDGLDNDGDGLTDAAQDPSCTTGRNERD